MTENEDRLVSLFCIRLLKPLRQKTNDLVSLQKLELCKHACMFKFKASMKQIAYFVTKILDFVFSNGLVLVQLLYLAIQSADLAHR